MWRSPLFAMFALLFVGCSRGGGKPSTLPGALVVRDYEPARGASQLWASPDGRWLAAELIFVGETLPAVIKVIERATGKVVAHGRGSVVAGPDDLAEVIYVTTADRARPVLRSTTRPELALPLPAAAGGFAHWSGFRLGKTRARLAVLREDPDGVAILLFELPKESPIATLTLPNSELSVLANAHSPTDDFLYLSGKTAGVSGAGAVLAIDGNTLRERWRAAWPKGHGFDDRPALGVTGDGRSVAAYAPSGLLVLDAASGTGEKMFNFYGHDPVQLVGVPGHSLLVALRLFASSPEPPVYAIDAIELPSGTVTQLRPESGQAIPTAIAVIGSTVLLAPGAPPRWPTDPSSWGPEVREFVGK